VKRLHRTETARGAAQRERWESWRRERRQAETHAAHLRLERAAQLALDFTGDEGVEGCESLRDEGSETAGR
jgi:hypothetical protein